eukprot:CAMPEP_0175666690 /NCGR_PEP_ID=MMETSP0097-20121207/17715_1 /TAXON_ID=311494 /ORGANISM="Alexandrium monilatum, Strain CCMP3105" /LENGTH=184 /DNA_ID=CAMNT_0016973123 /DNA_START=70 /DNA_END=624 /DNA_ORIENTATION=-
MTSTVLLSARRLATPLPRCGTALGVCNTRSLVSGVAPGEITAAALLDGLANKKLDAQRLLQELSRLHPVYMISMVACPSSRQVKDLFSDLGAQVKVIGVDGLPEEAKDGLQRHLKAATGEGSVPKVYVFGRCLGGFGETQRLYRSGGLVPLLVEAGAMSEQVTWPKLSFNFTRGPCTAQFGIGS